MGCAASKPEEKRGVKRQPSNKQGQVKRGSSKKQSQEEPAFRPISKDDRLLSLNNGQMFSLGPEVDKGVETRLRRLSAPAIRVDEDQEQVDGSDGGKDVAGKEKGPVLRQLSTNTARVRRLSMVGAVDEQEGGDDASSTPSREGGAPAAPASGDASAPAGVFGSNSAAAPDGRSRSLASRELDKLNLMDKLIHSVASLSRAGREPSYRKTNQDNCFAYQQYLHPSQALFGVFDGHGPNGHKVSAFVKQQIPVILAKEQEHDDDSNKALTQTFLNTHEALVSSSVDCEFSGCTGVVCFLHGRQLSTAWVGDSRAVLARQEPRGLRGVQLTKDHKPAAFSEKQRIVAAGGRVERVMDAAGKPIGPARVWLAHSWVPGLAMSRALGDAVAHTVGVTSEPDTYTMEVLPQDKWLVLASDGVWEFINCEDAVQLISGCQNAEQACRLLVDKAHDRWVEEEDGVVDDITVVAIKFK